MQQRHYDNIGAALEGDGVYSFDAKKMTISAIGFEDINIQTLAGDLEKEYKGKQINAFELFSEHHPKTRYCGSHYAKALRQLVSLGKIGSTFTDDKAHKVSVLLIKECILTF